MDELELAELGVAEGGPALVGARELEDVGEADLALGVAERLGHRLPHRDDERRAHDRRVRLGRVGLVGLEVQQPAPHRARRRPRGELQAAGGDLRLRVAGGDVLGADEDALAVDLACSSALKRLDERDEQLLLLGRVGEAHGRSRRRGPWSGAVRRCRCRSRRRRRRRRRCRGSAMSATATTATASRASWLFFMALTIKRTAAADLAGGGARAEILGAMVRRPAAARAARRDRPPRDVRRGAAGDRRRRAVHRPRRADRGGRRRRPIRRRRASTAAPTGWTRAAVVYPGLIDLHNHIAYNCLPLWIAPGAVGAVDRARPVAEGPRLPAVDLAAGQRAVQGQRQGGAEVRRDARRSSAA